MLEVVTGLREVVEVVAGLKGRIWLKIDPSREVARNGARLTRVTRVKRAAEARRMRRALERASVKDGRELFGGHGQQT